MRNPPLLETAGDSLAKGIERREVEKRIYGEERMRLTASATFLVIRIPEGFEQQIAELKTKFYENMNKSRFTVPKPWGRSPQRWESSPLLPRPGNPPGCGWSS